MYVHYKENVRFIPEPILGLKQRFLADFGNFTLLNSQDLTLYNQKTENSKKMSQNLMNTGLWLKMIKIKLRVYHFLAYFNNLY